VGGGYRTNSSDDSMLDANVSVGDGSIGDGSIFVGDNIARIDPTTVTALVASVVNPARATVGLEAAADISSLSSSLSAAEYGFPQYA